MTVWADVVGVVQHMRHHDPRFEVREQFFVPSPTPEQMNDLSDDPNHAGVVDELEATLQKLLAEAHDEFLAGNAYVEWVDRERNIINTGLGPVAE